MRIIRKLRLDVSEISSHSWFRSQNKSKKCPHCCLDQDETLAHFFLICPAFSKQRAQFHDNVVPILNDLSLPYSVSSFLGFDQRLKSKHFSKSQCSNRRRLYKTTCDFLQSTGRFKFVWFVLPPILHSWYFCIFHWVMYHFSLPSCIWDFVYIWLTLWILIFFFYGYFFSIMRELFSDATKNLAFFAIS